MAAKGIGPYKEQTEAFTNYLERFEQYCEKHKLGPDGNGQNDTRRAEFIAEVGPEAYKILKSLLSPDLPKTKTYDDITKVLKEYYDPEPITIAERFKFYNRDQGDEDDEDCDNPEDLSRYILALKQLAATCKFGNFLKEALRDRLVCGLKSKEIQDRLLLEAELTFESACKTALAMGMAAKDGKCMKPKRKITQKVKEDDEVNKIYQAHGSYSDDRKSRFPRKQYSMCRYCGEKHEWKKELCPAFGKTCTACHRKNHISKM